MNPKNFPELTLNTHFSRLALILSSQQLESLFQAFYVLSQVFRFGDHVVHIHIYSETNERFEDFVL